MGNVEKLMNQIMELKLTSKRLQREARKCNKDENSEKLKVKKAIEKGNLQKMLETMDSFERQFVNMEVQAELIESSMAGSTSLSTPEDQVGSLMQQVANDYGLEVSVGLPQVAGHAISSKDEEKVSEDDLSRRLAELKACG
ncbi:hypothetical protein H5410_014587 [Solanum commersonii]|uniref:Uncharacterized protein n=1 Tax=Solanum commersonii TaxID=4109 RepID=A0A9J5ZRN2_SOLCO|nr:hypothetical protein H5410_014587 [Solanum commersonii]